ncbi:hypothetical protein BDP27DRAFT_1361986 [Rhodocollybia butyracea]|uniref:Uncharacterized protein n=1 Tax=Rhodocollybia butyracea TaxID=206335 RepID=A0A9P5PWF0_9AGAR|nr:hypothetical protein BDP27DRAFT_1361986 [Rhodocollybia butyracea]
MLANLNISNIAALSAAASVSILIADTTGTNIVGPNDLCEQYGPISALPTAYAPFSKWNIVPGADGTTQFASITCPGFSLSYAGEKTGAPNLSAQAVLQPNSNISFTVTPVVAGQTNGPFFISCMDTPFPTVTIFLTIWAPNTTSGFSPIAPVTFEEKNTNDVRQQFQLLVIEVRKMLNAVLSAATHDQEHVAVHMVARKAQSLPSDSVSNSLGYTVIGVSFAEIVDRTSNLEDELVAGSGSEY